MNDLPENLLGFIVKLFSLNILTKIGVIIMFSVIAKIMSFTLVLSIGFTTLVCGIVVGLVYRVINGQNKEQQT